MSFSYSQMLAWMQCAIRNKQSVKQYNYHFKNFKVLFLILSVQTREVVYWRIFVRIFYAFYSLNTSFALSLSQLTIWRVNIVLVLTQKSAVNSSRQTWRVFSTITNSPVKTEIVQANAARVTGRVAQDVYYNKI